MLLLFIFAPIETAQAISASPEPVELQQPDGTQITLNIRGDEFFNWYEDQNGYTVVRDDDRYAYATLDSTQNLAPTSMTVGKEDPQKLGLKPRLLPPATIIQDIRRQAMEPLQLLPSSAAAPSGTVKNLVILCKFSDHTYESHTRPRAEYDAMFNAAGGDPQSAPTGSVRDYYFETSYGAMVLESTVVDWVELPHSEAYYANGENGLSMDYPNNAQGMVEDALNLVDPLVDFSNFDDDNNGYIDAITIIHSGYAGETGGGGGNWIWSHHWGLWSLPSGRWVSDDVNDDGFNVKVREYHTESALWGSSGTEISRIGVICHEMGHLFGLPDLYDTDGSGSSGIGSYGIMSNSWGFDFSQQHPPHFSAWCKINLGWLTPSEIGGSGIYTLSQSETSAMVYKITSGYPDGEYLLIENRQPVGFESIMPQGGLAIWHIDEAKGFLYNEEEGYPGQSNWPENNKHYRVALLQADGEYDLERGDNRGDSGDLYHGGGNTLLNDASLPNAQSYQGGTIQNSMIEISQISDAGTTMTFQFDNDSLQPMLQVSGGPLHFGSMDIDAGATGPLTVTVTNDGSSELLFVNEGISIGGQHAGDFSFANGINTDPLPVGESRDIEVIFDPSASGFRTAVLKIETNDSQEPEMLIGLDGEGEEGQSPPQVSITGDITVYKAGMSENTPIASIWDNEDSEGDLSVSASGVPADVELQLTNDNGTVSATTIAGPDAQAGVYAVQLTVIDSDLETTSAPVEIDVRENTGVTGVRGWLLYK